MLCTYNSTHHSAIDMAPCVFNWANAERVWESLYLSLPRRRPKWVVGLCHLHLLSGDQVRMSQSCRQYATCYKSQWSEIFHARHQPSDQHGGRFCHWTYQADLLQPWLKKVTSPDYFDVEAILDTRQHGNMTQYLIKWDGYPDSFNSWESYMVWINGDSVIPQQRRHVELSEPIMLHGNDYEVTLDSFTFPRTWYNVPDLAGQMHAATFAFQQGHLYGCGGSSNAADVSDACAEAATAEEAVGGDEMPAELNPCQNTLLIKSQRTLSPRCYEHIR